MEDILLPCIRHTTVSRKKNAEKLISDGRVNFVCPADYTKDRDVYTVTTTILDKIKSDFDFEQLLEKHRLSADKTSGKTK